MFCVGCGEKLQSGWQHCPSCGAANVKSAGAPKASKATSSDGQRSITDASAKKLLSSTSYAHWQVAGKPEVIFEDNEIIGFDLTNEDVAVEFLRFATWLIGTEDFDQWKEAGYPLVDFFYEDLQHYEKPDGYEEQTQTEIEASLDSDSLKVWKKAGKPKLARNSEGDWAFVDDFGRYKWAMVTDPITDDDLFGGGSSTEEESISYAEAKKLVDAQTFSALQAAGSPDLVMRDGRVTWRDDLTEEQYEQFALAILSPASARIWLAAGKPDVNDFIEGMQKQLDELEEGESSDDVHYIQSDAEFKQWFSRADFKGWKKYGRPSAVVINNEHPMLEVQWHFYQHYGYQMTYAMVDGWYFAGCPDITRWDVDGTMRIYQETVANMMGIQAQNRADNWAGVAGAISSGLSDIGNAMARNAGQTSDSKSLAERMREAQTTRCSRCGQPKPGSVCAYCQGRER